MIIFSSSLLSSTASPEPVSESSDSMKAAKHRRSRNILDRVEGSATLVSQVSHLIWYCTFSRLILYSSICVPLDVQSAFLCNFDLWVHQETHPIVLFVACLWLVWISNPVNSEFHWTICWKSWQIETVAPTQIDVWHKLNGVMQWLWNLCTARHSVCMPFCVLLRRECMHLPLQWTVLTSHTMPFSFT